MKAAVVLLFVSFNLVSFVFSQSTTPFLPQVFVGKCYERNPTGVDCTQLWDTFSEAAQMSNSVVNDSNYAPFLELSDFNTAPNDILFWSGGQSFALSIANNNIYKYMSIEGTSTGYVLNGLSWCGNSSNSFDYVDQCLYPSNSTYYGTSSVWAQGSHLFAQGANGNITILLQPARLNYNSGPYMAYRNTSVFYQVELPSMNVSRIQSVTVLLLTNFTLAPYERCGNASLVNLTHDIKAKFGFAPTCIDDPQKVYETLCPPGFTTSPQCLEASVAYGRLDKLIPEEKMYRILAIFVTVTLCAVTVLAIYFGILARKLSLQAHGYSSVRTN